MILSWLCWRLMPTCFLFFFGFVMWVDFRIAHFMGYSFVYEFWDYQLWWETQRRFPLNTNLTKWLSKYEGALQEGKEKTQVLWLSWWRCGNKRHEKKHKMMKKAKHKWIKVWKNGVRKRKEKHKGEELRDAYAIMNHATWKGRRLQDKCWRAATWSAQTPKIRPNFEETKLTKHYCRVSFLFQIQV